MESAISVRKRRSTRIRISPRSFTKQFTAMAVMLLVHDGKLRYDQTLTGIFPDFPAYGKSDQHSKPAKSHFRPPDYEDLMNAS